MHGRSVVIETFRHTPREGISRVNLTGHARMTIGENAGFAVWLAGLPAVFAGARVEVLTFMYFAAVLWDGTRLIGDHIHTS